MSHASVSRFVGDITGLGSSSGVRVVVGHWTSTTFGAFTDVMVEDRAGWRVLLAPTDTVAAYVSSTYTFDEVVIGPIELIGSTTREVTAPGLQMRYTRGRRTGIGRLLRLVPRRLAVAPPWLRLINPVARLLLAGVSTTGSAGGGRTEYYGASDVHAVTGVSGTWRGTPLGDLRPVDPPVRFGFGSTPAAPSVTQLTTTIVE